MIYYYPNRPMLIPPDPDNPLDPQPGYLTGLEKSRKYVMELKYNGENALIMIDKGYKTIEFWNRHKELLKRYRPSAETIQEIKERFPPDSIINAELMQNKVAGPYWKDIFIVHCVMKWDGKLMVGKTWGDSRKLIENMGDGKHIKISSVYTTHFFDMFKRADGKLIEGIVLKDPTGLLKFSTTPIEDTPWMLKIRKPKKGNYGF